MKNLLAILFIILCIFSVQGQNLSESQSPEPLTTRQPSLEQLTDYLLQFPPFSDGTATIPEHRQDDVFHWYETDSLQYIDLNEDNELDLVVHSYMHITVMVWLGDQYSPPFQLFDAGGHRNPYSKVTFDDWTNDGIPEVVFHERKTPYTGTDIGGHIFKDTVIHCTQTECHSIWDDVVFDNFNNYSVDGTYIQQTSIEHSLDDNVIPQIDTTTTEFVYGCAYGYYLENDMPQPEGQYFYSDRNRVGSIIQKHYIWNGNIFELVSETHLNEPYVMDIPTQYMAQSAEGDIAKIRVERVSTGYGGQVFPQCQIIINDARFDDPFFCNSAYLTWQDITGDAHEELVVTADAGFTGSRSGERHCSHQRLIAYYQSNDGFDQIANFMGCLVQIDGFGIRLENVDDDTALEIIVGSNVYTYGTDPCYGGFCWYEPNFTNVVYNWDGTTYGLSHTIPREPYQP